ncbi:MAG: hypothetical protein RCO49_03800 [Rickettsia endosymbiont of Argas persicus]
MFNGQYRVPQEVAVERTAHEKLIEFLEERVLTGMADSLRNGATKLNLLNKKIGDTGAKELALILKDNPNITSIDLFCNEITESGAKELALMLKRNSTITLINLSDNNIGVAGVKELALMLKDNSTITSIYLSANKIGAAGVKELAEMLKVNSTITSINLTYNKIGAAGVKELALMLKDNSTITSINLNYNGIGDKELKNIDNAIKHNKLVKNLVIFLKESYSDKRIESDNLTKSASIARCYKKLLKKHSLEYKFENSESIIEKMSKLSPFYISEICKNIKAEEGVLSTCKELGYPNGHIEKLPMEILLHITSYLEYTPWGWEIETIGKS